MKLFVKKSISFPFYSSLSGAENFMVNNHPLPSFWLSLFGADKQYILFCLLNNERCIAALDCWGCLEDEKLNCLLCQTNTDPTHSCF